MGVIQKVSCCFIVLSFCSFKIPFLEYSLKCFTEANSDSLPNSVMYYKILQSQNSNRVPSLSEENFDTKLLSLLTAVAKDVQFNKLEESEKTRLTRSVSDNSATNNVNRGTPTFTNFFRDPTIPFVRLYRFWQPSYVSETITSEDWFGSEATVEYKVTRRSLLNMSNSTFNVTVNVDETTSELPILLYGSSSLFTPGISTRPTDFVSLGSISVPKVNSAGTTRVSFQITDFIRRSSFNDDPNALATQKVRIVFLVRRQCNSIILSDCSTIINSNSTVPYLKVNYIQND